MTSKPGNPGLDTAVAALDRIKASIDWAGEDVDALWIKKIVVDALAEIDYRRIRRPCRWVLERGYTGRNTMLLHQAGMWLGPDRIFYPRSCGRAAIPSGTRCTKHKKLVRIGNRILELEGG